MTPSVLKTLIDNLPKTELHVHIEGTLEPDLMFEIAKRNQVKLRFKSVEEVREAYSFTNLQSFLDIYYEGARVLIHRQDFYDLTWAYLERISSQNVRHVEIFFDPQTHTDRGVNFSTVVEGIYDALQDGRTRFGITAHMIMCFLRHLDANQAMKTLEQALPYRKLITAVGLDSGEVGNPPEKFAAVYERARNEGFLAVAHAGEEGPPDYIWEALDVLKVKRIDHGVRCLEDNKLVERLAKERVPLTVCPLSNLKLCVVKALKDHPLKRMLNAGICATVNSDDPSYFGGYLLDNYLKIAEALQLTEDEITTLAKNGFEASFMLDSEKAKYYSEIDQVVEASRAAANFL